MCLLVVLLCVTAQIFGYLVKHTVGFHLKAFHKRDASPAILIHLRLNDVDAAMPGRVSLSNSQLETGKFSVEHHCSQTFQCIYHETEGV